MDADVYARFIQSISKIRYQVQVGRMMEEYWEAAAEMIKAIIPESSCDEIYVYTPNTKISTQEGYLLQDIYPSQRKRKLTLDLELLKQSAEKLDLARLKKNNKNDMRIIYDTIIVSNQDMAQSGDNGGAEIHNALKDAYRMEIIKDESCVFVYAGKDEVEKCWCFIAVMVKGDKTADVESSLREFAAVVVCTYYGFSALARLDEIKRVMRYFSHEIQQPEMPLRNNLELLMAQELPDLGVNPENHLASARIAAEYFRKAKSHIPEMLNLFGNLDLVFDMAINRDDVLDVKDVSIIKVVQDLKRRYDVQLANKSMVLQYDALEDFFISGDETKTKVIFDNLLRNAIKYGLKGTYISIAAIRAGGEVEIRFQNIGYVIDESRNTEIFEVGTTQAYTKNANHYRKAAGSGFGLPIALENAYRMKGSLELEHKKSVPIEPESFLAVNAKPTEKIALVNRSAFMEDFHDCLYQANNGLKYADGCQIGYTTFLLKLKRKEADD